MCPYATTIPKQCPACGVDFETNDPRTRFCSRSCGHKRGSVKPREKTGVTLSCEQCGDKFYRYQSDIRKADKRGGKTLYCSSTCANKARLTGERAECICNQCGEPFTVMPGQIRWAEAHDISWGIYCSAQCRNAANADRYERDRFYAVCSTCGVTFADKRCLDAVRKRAFCSPQCRHAAVHTWASSRGRVGVRPDIGPYRFRSTWEANFARFLQAAGLVFEYEPRTFECEGVFYTPDFWVAEWGAWVEVKGWMNFTSAEKIVLFRERFPEERLIIVGKAGYESIVETWSPVIPEWE